MEGKKKVTQHVGEPYTCAQDGLHVQCWGATVEHKILIKLNISKSCKFNSNKFNC